MLAVTCVALTKVVASPVLPTVTEVDVLKPLPVTVSVVLAAPAATLAGLIDVTVGAAAPEPAPDPTLDPDPEEDPPPEQPMLEIAIRRQAAKTATVSKGDTGRTRRIEHFLVSGDLLIRRSRAYGTFCIKTRNFFRSHA